MLQYFTEQYSEIWKNCPDEFPKFPFSYTHSAHEKKEQILDRFLESMKNFRKERVSKQLFTEVNQQQFLKDTRLFLGNGLDFTSGQLEIMFSDNLTEVTKNFVRQARDFDPGLSFTDIFQACRNAWIMNGLQLIMGIPVRLSPSIFAYSMLYPYTDNYIDNPEISVPEKMIFSDRFRDRLSGKKLIPDNKTELAIFKLVEMIENQYSRTEFPDVYESLLDIHDSQTNSLKLIQCPETLTNEETLKICLAKGGASVLADGFLVSGKLSEGQKYFLYGYGAYLQLLDDIQDVYEDYNAGLMTIFSKEAIFTRLDEKLNKTYWFGEKAMQSINRFDGQYLDVFLSLIRKSTELFIIEAIAQNPDFYSSKYVSEMEGHSPFSFSYIREKKGQFAPYNGFLLTALEEIAFKESMMLPE